MKKIGSFLLSVLMLFGGMTAGIGVEPALAQDKKVGDLAPANAPVKDIEVTAKKYEFSPSRIEVPLGTLLKIHLVSLDVEHGFQIKSYSDSCVRFKPGSPMTVEFYAEKSGEFEFACCKYCGLGHGKMKGKLIVH